MSSSYIGPFPLDVWRLIIDDHIMHPRTLVHISSTCKSMHKWFHAHSRVRLWKSYGPNHGMLVAILSNFIDMVQMYVARGANHWNAYLQAAIYMKNNTVINMCLENGASVNQGLYYATRYRNVDLVIDFVRVYGATDYNGGLDALESNQCTSPPKDEKERQIDKDLQDLFISLSNTSRNQSSEEST